ncbi:dTDP-glucose 4,6-dehydratase [Veillonella sp. oral taxon 780]|uniref:dTDP-glucose 4,6-dehydratase n=1 Tax=Veillonella sp. oral taxon 780 TaxID=671229 RepID=UPI00021A2A2E|nr:dTDP-glucose 4,6-dehydratase [Veillonella sp. oral taxon 780]EGS35593.1 dTDP-glucose 4,6-dehydratase [Veillonella sp. oral taxon 780 str. F0422]
MNILVTGGCGFIGSHFLRYMMDTYTKDSFICLDALTYAGNENNIKDLLEDSRLTMIEGNIRDASFVDTLLVTYKPDVVVHLAAETHVDRSITGPQVFLETNVIGTGVLLDACLRHGIERFHHVSTDEVYGTLPLQGGNPFTEQSPLLPSSPYAASKASSDLLVLSYYKTYGLPITISRCSNNYGTHQYPEKLIPLMIQRALQEVPLPVYGDGLNVRDWIHVLDHCRAIDCILYKGRVGEVYNVGAREEISNIDLVKRILTVLGKPYELITYVEDRLGHDRRYAIDSSKLESLAWKREYTMKDTFTGIVEWYRDALKS